MSVVLTIGGQSIRLSNDTLSRLATVAATGLQRMAHDEGRTFPTGDAVALHVAREILYAIQEASK